MAKNDQAETVAVQATATRVASPPTPQTTTPQFPAPRDRRGESPEPSGVVLEGIVNPRPKDFDPTNPAGAPRIEAVHDSDEMACAHAELTDLLRRDTSKLTPAEKRDHDTRVHQLHYHANGLDAPTR